ncbi:unnamed protein product [Boreogadus saida]
MALLEKSCLLRHSGGDRTPPNHTSITLPPPHINLSSPTPQLAHHTKPQPTTFSTPFHLPDVVERRRSLSSYSLCFSFQQKSSTSSASDKKPSRIWWHHAREMFEPFNPSSSLNRLHRPSSHGNNDKPA